MTAEAKASYLRNERCPEPPETKRDQTLYKYLLYQTKPTDILEIDPQCDAQSLERGQEGE